MCAIAGILFHKKNPRSIDENNVLNAMAHRGPDGQSSWKQTSIDDNNSLEIQLFHSRLAILDLSQNARQPFFSKSNNTVMTFNGEIYNFKTLKNQYSITTLTSSDSEVLTELFELKTIDALDSLDGMFAFGAYSKNTNKLTLAVDPAGKKPIYTYWDGQTFAFASEIKILKAMGLPIEISREDEMKYLFFGYIPAPATYYKNIRKLPAGHFQIIMNGKPEKIQRYFSLPTNIRTISYEDAKHETQLLIQKAIQKRLISDRPLGSFLSGGLDSSIICYEASQLIKDPLKTFSISFQKSALAKHYDESVFASLVARLLNSQHTTFEMDNQFDQMPKIISHFDEPFADSSCFPMAQLCQQTSKEVKVVLSGDGGDELYGGYLRFKASLIAESANKYKSITDLLFKSVFFDSQLKRTLDRFRSARDEKPIHRLALWNSFFSFKDIAALSTDAEEKLRVSLQNWDNQLSGLSLPEKLLHFNFYNYLFNDLLPKVDRMSMLYGLEVRSPFLDKDLIQSAFTLPTKYKFNMLNSKKILKDIYRQQLSKKIVDRAKKGFGFHLETIVDNPDTISQSQKTYLKLANTPSKKFCLMSLSQFQTESKGPQ